MIYFKENYNFTRFRGGGGPTYSRGGGRELGVQMLILETLITFDFQEGVRTLYPPPPLDPHMWPFNYS